MTQPPVDPPPGPYGEGPPSLPPPPPLPPPLPSHPTTTYPAHWSEQELSAHPASAHKPGTNGFAIASLIFGIIGGCLLAMIFGIVALRQIRRTGQAGRGMAIAGLVLTGVWALLAVAVAVSGLDEADRNTRPGQTTNKGHLATQDLALGDCVNGLKDGVEVSSIEGVPCSDAHDGEVFALIDVGGRDFPGIDALQRQAGKECSARLQEDHPKAYADKRVDLFYLRPTQDSWSRGDRQLTCLVEYETRRAGVIDDAYLTTG